MAFESIYNELHNTTNCRVWAIFDHHGEYAARIVTRASKSNMTVFAYVYYLGTKMVKGRAGGGGYNRHAAAINDAADKFDTVGHDETVVKFFDVMRKDDFQRQLESLGYRMVAIL